MVSFIPPILQYLQTHIISCSLFISCSLIVQSLFAQPEILVNEYVRISSQKLKPYACVRVSVALGTNGEIVIRNHIGYPLFLTLRRIKWW